MKLQGHTYVFSVEEDFFELQQCQAFLKKLADLYENTVSVKYEKKL